MKKGYNKAKFDHNIKKKRRQGYFERYERQKLNNLFSIMANEQLKMFKDV